MKTIDVVVLVFTLICLGVGLYVLKDPIFISYKAMRKEFPLPHKSWPGPRSKYKRAIILRIGTRLPIYDREAGVFNLKDWRFSDLPGTPFLVGGPDDYYIFGWPLRELEKIQATEITRLGLEGRNK